MRKKTNPIERIALVLLVVFAVPAHAGLFDNQPGSQPNSPPQNNQPATPPPESAPAAPARPGVKAVAVAAAPPTKLAMPDEAAQQAAEKEVDEIFGKDVAKAHTASDWTALSNSFRETGISTADPATRFVLLHDSEGFAVKANDVDAALAVHQELVKTFDLGTSRVVTEVFQKLDRTSNEPDLEKLCHAITFALDDAIAEDKYEAARQIGRMANAIVAKLSDRAMGNRLAALVASVPTREAEYKRISPALATHAANPNDAAANAAVGRYYCFVKHDWPTGLALLAVGNDPILKQLAARELAAPTDAASQVTLADLWWNFSEGQPPAASLSVRLHSGQLYSLASSGLQGLSKLKAEKRAAEYLETVRLSSPLPAISSAKPPPPGPTVAGYTSLLEILQSLPPSLFPATLVGWNDQRRAAVNDALQQQIVGKDATFVIDVEKIDRNVNYLKATSRVVVLGPFTGIIDAAFNPEKRDLWPSIVNGGTYVVTGPIFSAHFQGAQLSVFMSNCHIVTKDEFLQNSKKLAAPANPGAAAIPPGITELKSIDQVVAIVPTDVLPASDEEWHDSEKTNKFVSAFRTALQRKTFKASVKIARIDVQSPEYTYLRTDSTPVGPNKLSLAFKFKALDPLLANFREGETYTIAGNVTGFSYGASGLVVTMTRCRLISTD